MINTSHCLFLEKMAKLILVRQRVENLFLVMFLKKAFEGVSTIDICSIKSIPAVKYE